MSQRIRGQEATVQIIVDGDVKSGTFSKVTDFSLDPRMDVNETDFLGEVETDLDVQHHGFDFQFTLQEQDDKTHDLLVLIVEREQARERHPSINIVVTFNYRAGNGAQTIVLENCFMKLDSLSIGGRKDYITNRWSGKCKTISEV